MSYKEMNMVALKAMYNEAKAELDAIKKHVNAISSEIESRVAPLLNDYGTKQSDVDGVAIKIVKSKNIEWDEDKLIGLWKQIDADGADPSAYIKRKEVYAVSETAYKEWSDELREIFSVARIEKEPKVKFEFMEE
jgi:hypothetical protein